MNASVNLTLRSLTQPSGWDAASASLSVCGMLLVRVCRAEQTTTGVEQVVEVEHPILRVLDARRPYGEDRTSDDRSLQERRRVDAGRGVAVIERVEVVIAGLLVGGVRAGGRIELDVPEPGELALRVAVAGERVRGMRASQHLDVSQALGAQLPASIR